MKDSISFELFKSNVCHRVKETGDIPFIIETLKSNNIRRLYNNQQYAKAMYLLAMVDYLSRENELPLCSEYNDIRRQKLSRTIYPESIIAYAEAVGSDSVMQKCYQNAIPEFIRFNIVENEVRNVL